MSRVHVVRQGECLSQIALRYGHRDYRRVYDHPANAALRADRPNPNVLHPGDKVTIPDLEPKSEEIATTRVHRFEVNVPLKRLRLRIIDRDGSPLADAPYQLVVGDEVREGRSTDGDGRLDEPVIATASHAVLRIADRELALALGSLNPTRGTPDRGISGVQMRLRNLGYPTGAIDGIAGRRTCTALALFQADQHLPETADPTDAATLAKLEEIHGS
jgi:putative peptidoglycan binding protein